MSAIVRVAVAADRIERNDGAHGGSVAVRFYFQPAVHFEQSLPHSGQTDAVMSILNFESSTVITKFQAKFFRLAAQSCFEVACMSVLERVGQRFLPDM